LGIHDVSLYLGSRHSSASDLGQYYSPEEVMSDETGHYFKILPQKLPCESAKEKGHRIDDTKG